MMKIMHKITFYNGKENQVFSVDNQSFRYNEPVYLEKIPSGVKKFLSYLKIEKATVEEVEEQKRKGVVYVAEQPTYSYMSKAGEAFSFTRNKVRFDLPKEVIKEIEGSKDLQFKIVKEEKRCH